MSFREWRELQRLVHNQQSKAVTLDEQRLLVPVLEAIDKKVWGLKGDNNDQK